MGVDVGQIRQQHRCHVNVVSLDAKVEGRIAVAIAVIAATIAIAPPSMIGSDARIA